jgi:hypothetical protein
MSSSMKIDVFAHILPEKYLAIINKKYGRMTIDNKADIKFITHHCAGILPHLEGRRKRYSSVTP